MKRKNRKRVERNGLETEIGERGINLSGDERRKNRKRVDIVFLPYKYTNVDKATTAEAQRR